MTIHAALTEGEFSLKESLLFACRLAKRLDTPLIGISAMPDPARAMLMTGASMHGLVLATGGSLTEGIREAQTEARKNLETLFVEVCAAEGLASDMCSVEHHVGLPTEIYPKLTLLSEAFVTPHECVSIGNDHGLAFEATLLDKRLPVISSGTHANPNLDTVIIAWDGSPQAARAVRFHTSILKAASRIIIAQNADKIDDVDRDGSEDPAQVQVYLANSGLSSEIRKFDGKVVDGLLRLAETENAGVIIAGAYGHSRIEEFIFGGVSRNLLRAENGPALALAH